MENMHSEAKKKFIQAKIQENARIVNDDEIYCLFESACNKYEKTTAYIDERKNAVDYAYAMSKEERLKQEKREKRNFFWTVVGIVLAVLGVLLTVAFGIYGVVVAIK